MGYQSWVLQCCRSQTLIFPQLVSLFEVSQSCFNFMNWCSHYLSICICLLRNRHKTNGKSIIKNYILRIISGPIFTNTFANSVNINNDTIRGGIISRSNNNSVYNIIGYNHDTSEKHPTVDHTQDNIIPSPPESSTDSALLNDLLDEVRTEMILTNHKVSIVSPHH